MTTVFIKGRLRKITYQQAPDNDENKVYCEALKMTVSYIKVTLVIAGTTVFYNDYSLSQA